MLRYTYVSLGHHFRGTAIPWESKVSFKHSEVLSYQSEIEFLAKFLSCETRASHSIKVADSVRNRNGGLGNQRTSVFTIASRVGNICRPNAFL
jgi:hypothetical protein